MPLRLEDALLPGPIFPFRYSDAEISEICEVLENDGASPDDLIVVMDRLVRATLWFLLMLVHKA